ncbi:MAG: hypothetical protein ACM3H8_16055 [Sphingobacteriales bacterium]
MKKLFNAAMDCNAKSIVKHQLSARFTRSTVSLFYLVALMSAFLFVGCSKQEVSGPASEAQPLSINRQAANTSTLLFPITDYTGLSPKTLLELQEARSATTRYLDINNAFKDGYEDLHIVVDSMGSHYMKFKQLDSVFDFRKPEILVYHEKGDGTLELGAVEYAVPIALSPDAAPEGFTGSDDEWERNETYGLWLQHAWVWTFNPKGVFHDTNPLVK